jgi:pyruvate/2-oxoglutarate dehydrogenase complex dihydrolipoamide acyltransferase (E2) component
MLSSIFSRRAFSSLARPTMSPSARAVLFQNHLNPDTIKIKGTGRRGLLQKGDVLLFLKNQANQVVQPTNLMPKKAEQTFNSFDQVLRTSKSTIPHSYFSCGKVFG